MEPRIFNAIKKHFEDGGENVNNAQLRNATSTVCMFLLDEDLLLEILIKTLYPIKGGKK